MQLLPSLPASFPSCLPPSLTCPSCPQVNGSLLARTPTATQVADLLAAAGGDWASVLALLTGQATSVPGTVAASGTGSAHAAGSQSGAVTINTGSGAL